MVGPASAPPSSFTIGTTTPGPNSGAYSGLTGVRVTLTQSGAIKTIGFLAVGTVGTNMLLGAYSVDGSGNPFALVASSAVYSSTAGTIELPTTTHPVLTPGDYFLAEQGTGGINGYYDSGGSIPANTGAWNNGATLSGSTMPSFWPTASSGPYRFGFYATFNPATTFTVGATSQGASSGVFTPITGIQVTLATGGTVQSISMFSGSAGTPFFIGVYTDAGGVPGSLIASSVLVSSSVVGLMTIPIPSLPVLTAGTYWIAVQYQQFATSWTGYFDTPAGLGAYSACPWDGVAMAATWPSGSSTGPYHYSIFATLSS
jgi:hypothetical protein